MDKSISLDAMFEAVKNKDEKSKAFLDIAERTNQIIDKIVEAREKLGMSQRELAEKCCMKQPALARIETLRVVPKLNTLIQIANAVGIQIEAIGENEKQTINYSISINLITSECVYENSIGGYKWTQNLIASR